MNFSTTANDLTPAYTPADSLATTDRTHHSINAVRLNSLTKRKSVRVKFHIKRSSRNTDNGEIFTTAINAQGDTGADCSATDTIDIIHNYVEFAIPQDVGVFSADGTGSKLQALGEGVINRIQAIAPYMGQDFWVFFLKGCISLKIWT